MDFEEYEKKKYALYQSFAEEVQRIIEIALKDADGILSPQTIQARAKSPDSLKKRLAQAGHLHDESIEAKRKDLAGVRLIFYTNGDVEAFLQSGILRENFDIDPDQTRVHQPTKENKEKRYRGVHFIVQLNEDRRKLAEYKRYSGLRCEIQIQTILNHAWSETTHDTIYKDAPTPGFGERQHKAIKARFDKLMDDYLLKAGHELDKAIQDFRRLSQGRALFRGAPFDALKAATDNNERDDILTTIREHILPFYEDLPAVYDSVIDALLAAAAASRASPPKQIETHFGKFDGKTTDDIIAAVAGILVRTRFAKPEAVLKALIVLIAGSEGDKQRESILDATKKVAELDINVWQRVGSAMQERLLDAIDALTPDERAAGSLVVEEVWSQCLSTEITGTDWSYNAVTFKQGAVPGSEQVKSMRRRALDGLFFMLDEVNTDPKQRRLFARIWDGMRLPSRGEKSAALEAMLLADLVRVLAYLTTNLSRFSYELRERMEDRLLWKFRRVKGLKALLKSDPDMVAACDKVLTGIAAFRTALDADEEFVRYKTLVGFQGVFLPQWEDDNANHEAKEAYRLTRIAEFIEDVDEATFAKWRATIERCAATKSDDLATFPVFAQFIRNLAKTKAAIGLELLKRADTNTLQFLPAFLGGLAESGDSERYEAALAHIAGKPEHLLAVLRHYRSHPPKNLRPIETALAEAIEADDRAAVIECLALAMARYEEEGVVQNLLVPALKHLIAHDDARWVHATWYSDKASKFFTSISDYVAELMLTSLLALDEIEYQGEGILAKIAKRNPMRIWQFLRDRIARANVVENSQYRAVPFSLSTLREPLSGNAAEVVAQARAWYDEDDRFYQYKMGHVLAEVFRDLPDDFIAAMRGVIDRGDEKDFDFVLATLPGFDGKPEIHDLLREIVARIGNDEQRLGPVEACVEASGVLQGEFGRVEALRKRREWILAWMDDARESVREFAMAYASRLEQQIAREQARAERDIEMRKRDYDDPDDPDENPEEPDDDPPEGAQ